MERHVIVVAKQLAPLRVTRVDDGCVACAISVIVVIIIIVFVVVIIIIIVAIPRWRYNRVFWVGEYFV